MIREVNEKRNSIGAIAQIYRPNQNFCQLNVCRYFRHGSQHGSSSIYSTIYNKFKHNSQNTGNNGSRTAISSINPVEGQFSECFTLPVPVHAS